MLLRRLKSGIAPAAIAVAAGIAALIPSIGAAHAARGVSATAHAARSCSLVGRYRTLGATYVEHLSVSRTSCATGVRLIRRYNACRHRAGGAGGRCRRRIMGYKFTERRQSSPIQYVASVRARNGRRVVSFTYTQNIA